MANASPGASIQLPEDPVEAHAKYVKLRQLVRETFEGFLRSLNSQSLRWLEQQFERHGGNLDSGQFLRIFSRVCPRLESRAFPKEEERRLAVNMSVLKLFEGMDVDTSGETSWMEFVEFISAVAEELRLKAQELSGQILVFAPSVQVVLPAYRPTVTKCHFDKVFYWPALPMECAIVFEEGQASFFLHRQQSMLRRRRVDGHQSDVLSAAYLEEINLVVTSGNDKMLCFWESSAFNLVKKWSLKDVVGTLCWCPEINALYAADHFSERLWGWRIFDELEVKTTAAGGMKPDKSLEFKEGHKESIQVMKWLKPLQCLATASLDTTVQIFDTVLQARSHTLSGHTKGRKVGSLKRRDKEASETSPSGEAPEDGKGKKPEKPEKPDKPKPDHYSVVVTPENFLDVSTLPLRILVHRTAIWFMNFMFPSLELKWSDFSLGAEQAVRAVYEHLASKELEQLRGLVTNSLLQELRKEGSLHDGKDEKWSEPPRLLEVQVIALFSSRAVPPNEESHCRTMGHILWGEVHEEYHYEGSKEPRRTIRLLKWEFEQRISQDGGPGDWTGTGWQICSLEKRWWLSRSLTCLEFCAKSQMLLSAGFDNYISIWDPSAGTLSFKLEGHECSIAGLCAMPETDYEFMSVDFEGMVRLWDVRRLCCIQNFPATDRRAEEAGELERLEPRALCPLNRDRVVISGRRIVVFDRDANDPKVTSDWPINDLAFNHWTMEIVTPIKNDLYVWDALTGQRLQIHDNVIESNITAIKFGLKERRIFVGSEDGEINCINAACGAKLKVLTPHTYEVTQIECMSGKVLTLSAPEKVINVHDDTGEKKALLLKRIDLSDVGVILRFAHDDREMLAVTSEEGDVGWYSADFAKPIADTSQCSVNHSQAVYCCEYFRNVPLIITTDNCSAIFWSVPPLRAYDFFNKIMLELPGAEEGAVSISSMCLSWPDECTLFVGTDRGAILCVDITAVVESAGRQREEILRRKESGERAEVISGRIFDSLPKPVNSNEYVFFLDSIWTVEKAHGLSVESILFCKRQPSVLMTLGADNCLRIWDHATGNPLGSLEQGLPEGLIYERSTAWSFPLDPHLQIQSDINAVMESSAKSEDLDPERLRSPEDGHSLQHLAQRQTEECIAKLKKDRRRSIQMARSNSSPALAGQELPKFGFSNANLGQEFFAAAPRYLQGKVRDKKTQDWYAGSLAPGYSLPQLQSGLSRPPAAETKKVLEAARALAVSLGIRNSHDVLTP
eukprot:s427_g8.t3